MQVKVSAYFEKWHYRVMILFPLVFLVSVILKNGFGGFISVIGSFCMIPFFIAYRFTSTRNGTATIDDKGIGFKNALFRWDELREVGIGTNRFLSQQFYWIYFSKTSLIEEDRNPLKMKGYGRIELTERNLEMVRMYYDGPITHLSNAVLQRSDDQACRRNAPNYSVFAFVCLCLAIASALLGFEFRQVSHNGYNKSASLQTADLFLVTGTIASVEPVGSMVRVFIGNTSYQAQYVPSREMDKLRSGVGKQAEAYIVNGTSHIGILNIGGVSVLKLNDYKYYLNKDAGVASFAFFSFVFGSLYYAVYCMVCFRRATKKQPAGLPF